MTKIVLYGVATEYNFGFPSLLHGISKLIEEVCESNKIIFYQKTKPLDIFTSDFDFPIYQLPFSSNKELLLAGIKYKCGIKPKKNNQKVFFNHIETADIVADLYGICFCGDLNKNKERGVLKEIASTVNSFSLCIIAKLLQKKTIKTTSSYGPINTKNLIISAKFASKYIFDIMYAREYESQKQMKEIAHIKKDISVTPDLANYMLCNGIQPRKIVGISVSHQIIRQWKSEESYIKCIADLIYHIQFKLNYEIYLIPNETQPNIAYNDIRVAEDILKCVNNKNISIIDSANMNGSQLKTIIAGCEVMIASRYHSCVAALSAGVPLLVIGWHYKYTELLNLYKQEQWILSHLNCTSKQLIKTFDALWENRDKERHVIKEQYTDIKVKLEEAGRQMFMEL
jgi:polysaccharide pyruvyl transferase WcaK-like protein